jgi:porin
LDGDFQNAFGPAWPARSFEALLTAVYQYEVRGGWTVQPNFQYIVHPGGGATNPLGNNPAKVLRNAEVFGLRTVLKF